MDSEFEKHVLSLSREELLELAATGWGQYTHRAREAYIQRCDELNISGREVREWRRTHYDGQTASARCHSCGGELILDTDDLVAGDYSCPLCGSHQSVSYHELDLQPDAAVAEPLPPLVFQRPLRGEWKRWHIVPPVEDLGVHSQDETDRTTPNIPDITLSDGEREHLNVSQRVLKQTIRTGIIYGLFLTIAALVATLNPSSVSRDAMKFVDAGIILLLTFLLRRKSRFAAVSLVLYVLLDIILSLAESGGVGTVIFRLILLFFFIRGAFATFRLKTLLLKAGIKPDLTSQWIFVPSVFFIIAILLMAGFGTLIPLGILPNSTVVAGDDIGWYHRKQLLNHNIINPDDTIVYFYSDGLWSILEDGNFFTIDRAVSYERDSSGISLYEALWQDILSIDVVWKGEGSENTLIEVSTADSWFYLLVAPNEGKDSLFYQGMLQLWRERRVDSTVQIKAL